MRRKLIVGNWKMNGSLSHLEDFIDEVKLHLHPDVDAGLALPYTLISALKLISKNLEFLVAAQNMHELDSGAYTGEVSSDMIQEAGANAVILGHSERRAYYGETDEAVNLKLKKALEKSLLPIVCVGESLEEREEGRHEEKVEGQVVKALKGLSAGDMDKVVVAYEPIWAIGTGKTASGEDAEAMCAFIRGVVEQLFGPEAEKVRILYGGSVKPSNIVELMNKENIDGALVGGASLKASDFIALINF